MVSLLKRIKDVLSRKYLSELDILRNENLQAELNIQYLSEQLKSQQRVTETYASRNEKMAGYVEWLAARKSRAKYKELLMIRDFLQDGERGPYANSAGVHPAVRWGVKSYGEYEEEL